jgi:hypothetical protein
MNNIQASELVKQFLPIPDGYKVSFYQEAHHDKLLVIHIRLSKNDINELFMEHFSVTIDQKNKQLMGVIHLDKNFETDDYIDEEKAETIALDFLRKNAPDLLDTVEVRWIRPTRKIPQTPPHDEGFKLDTGEIITGMRVKLWANNTKKYAWVIVGANGQVINFERDIIWSTLKHRRTTEKWLHDDWLTKKKVQISC